jgi:hypothetical protein
MPPFIEAVIERVRAWFFPLPVSEGPLPWEPASYREAPQHDATAEPVAPAQPIVLPRKAKEFVPPSQAEFYFKESILDQLDHYFVCLHRMMKADPSSFMLYRQIGMHILPVRTLNDLRGRATRPHQLSPWWKVNRPGFGAFGFAIHPEFHNEEAKRKCFYPRFLYFTKYEARHAPLQLQRVSAGDVYLLTVYWDKPGDPKIKGAAPTEYAVAIDKDNEVTLLRSLHRSRVEVKAKHRPRNGAVFFTVPQQRWGIDEFFLDWAREHKTDPKDYLLSLFCDAAEVYEAAQTGVTRIDVEKNHMHCAFSVAIKRTPYFFKDRDVSVNEAGTRKRIFHIVRPHARIGAGGRERFVRMHFRGERSFSWNGYRVRITVPGLHHASLNEWDVASVDLDALSPEERKKQFVGPKGFGRRLREILDGRPRTQNLP